jgi:Transposase DDE domain
MTSIAHLCDLLQTVLTVDATRLAREMKLRTRQFSASTLACVLIFGWLHNPQAGPSYLRDLAYKWGVQITKQSMQDHWTEATARWLLALLRQAVRYVVCGGDCTLALLQRFSAVLVEDGSTISLPASLSRFWKGCGGNGSAAKENKTQAAIKLTVRLDLLKGSLQGPYLHDGKTHDLKSELREQAMPKGSLWMGDLGYFALSWLKTLGQQGVFFLMRYKDPVLLWVDGKRTDLMDLLPTTANTWIDQPVLLGAEKHVKARLIAVLVPQDVVRQRHARIIEAARVHQKPVNARTLELAKWTILVSNVPQDLLTPLEAQSLIRARWQIELLFKLWKQHGLVDEWRSEHAERILCEVYAKLLAMVVQHWLLIRACWHESDRSMTALARTVREQVPTLIHALLGRLPLEQAMGMILQRLQQNAPLPPRRTRPSTAQLLNGAPYWGLT